MKHCNPPHLVSMKFWLPSEPFDFDWSGTHPSIGCSHLVCERCGEDVRWEPAAGGYRRYWCKCQQRMEDFDLPIGADQGSIHEFATWWYCAGHPLFQVPAILDGIDIPASGPFHHLVRRGILAPPFKPVDAGGPAFWVLRLYHLLPSPELQRSLSMAVADHLASTDARLVAGAISFFWHVPEAPGAGRLAQLAERHGARLAATPDPYSPGEMLDARLREALLNRLNVDHPEGGGVADDAALVLAREAALRGESTPGLVAQLALCDMEWLCEHAATIARGTPALLFDLLLAIQDAPEERSVSAAVALAALGDDAGAAVRAHVAESFVEPARSRVLAELHR